MTAQLTFRQTAMVNGTTIRVDTLADNSMSIQLSATGTGATIALPNMELIMATIRMMEEGRRFIERNKP